LSFRALVFRVGNSNKNGFGGKCSLYFRRIVVLYELAALPETSNQQRA
jgi:hypothetical protein